MIALEILGIIIAVLIFAIASWFWVMVLASYVIREYFNQREIYRKRIDDSIEEMIKEYPRA